MHDVHTTTLQQRNGQGASTETWENVHLREESDTLQYYFYGNN